MVSSTKIGTWRTEGKSTSGSKIVEKFLSSLLYMSIGLFHFRYISLRIVSCEHLRCDFRLWSWRCVDLFLVMNTLPLILWSMTFEQFNGYFNSLFVLIRWPFGPTTNNTKWIDWLRRGEKESIDQNQTKPMWRKRAIERRKNKHTHVWAQCFYFVEIVAAVKLLLL